MTLSRRQLDFRMQLAKEFAATPSGKPAHKSPNGLHKNDNKRKKFMENPRKAKQKGEQPL